MKREHLVSVAVGEVELGLVDGERHAGLLHVELHVHSLARLHPHYDLVRLEQLVRRAARAARREDVARHVAQLHAHLRLALVQRCTCMRTTCICVLLRTVNTGMSYEYVRTYARKQTPYITYECYSKYE